MQRRHVVPSVAAALLPAVAAALMLIASTPARADVRRMYEAGDWSLYTGTSTSGRAVCDMRVTDDVNSKKIDVIYFVNDDHLTVRMNKSTWQIPARTRLGIVLQFDAYPVWTATADGAGGDVEFTVPTNALTDFSRQFRYGSRMRISFPDGSEAPWLASLAGTSFMLDRFLECLQRIGGNGTQPQADTPALPTQPYAGGQSPHSGQSPHRGPLPQAEGAAGQGNRGPAASPLPSGEGQGEGEDTPSFGGGQRQPYRGTQTQPSTPAPAAPAPPAPAPSPAPPAAGNDDRI